MDDLTQTIHLDVLQKSPLISNHERSNLLEREIHIHKLTEFDLKNREKSCFDGGKMIDYVLAYKEDKNSYVRKHYLKNLQTAGLVLKLYDPCDYTSHLVNRDESILYILVHTPLKKLLEAAEKTRFKLPIEINDLEKATIMTTFWNKISNPLKLPKTNDRNYFTAPYDTKIKAKFEAFWDSQCMGQPDEFLSSKDRSLLTYEFLSRTTYYSKREKKQQLQRRSSNNFSSLAPNVDYAGIEKLLEDGVFLAAYPLHEVIIHCRSPNFLSHVAYCLKHFEKKGSHLEISSNRQYLWNNWANMFVNMLSYQPLYDIRQYFGEKVAFYFSWLGFYTTWLLIPSIIGFFVFIYGLINIPYDIPTNEICDRTGPGNTTMCRLCNTTCTSWKLYEACYYAKMTHVFDNSGTVIFSLVMALWAVFFIDFWKRQQNTYRFEWDTIDYESKFEIIRPEYERKVQKMKKKKVLWADAEPIIPFFQRYIKYLVSWSVVILAILLVLTILIGVIFYRISVYVSMMQNNYWRKYSSIIALSTAACINLVFILALSRLYTWCAHKLTELEMHRTDSDYESAFTIKMYLFQFFNYYSSIFYIAFIKGSRLDKLEFEPCDTSGCMAELCIQLAIIMVGKQFLNNIQEHIYPYVMQLVNQPCCLKKSRESSSLMQWEKDYKLLPWGMNSLFDEYLEMVIQFGFITLFVVAFPLAPLFAFLNNILEIRIDAHKFLVQMRRPLAKKAKDIGIWLNILNSVSKIGVISNGFIIAFTSEFIPRLVFMINQQKADLSGFMNYTLSIKRISNTNGTVEYCRYRDFREPSDTDINGKITIQYYYLTVARLAFIVVFENFIFLVVACLHWMIPDVPTVIKRQIERENIIIQNAIWTKNDEIILSNLDINSNHVTCNNEEVEVTRNTEKENLT